MNINRRFGLVVLVIVILALGTVAAIALPSGHRATGAKYYCVLLTNGQVYFGRLSGLGSPFPELSDVYYIASEPTGKSGESQNVLMKRGTSEWHRPDKMLLNGTQVVLVEPVNPTSVVAQRIRELNEHTTSDHAPVRP